MCPSYQILPNLTYGKTLIQLLLENLTLLFVYSMLNRHIEGNHPIILLVSRYEEHIVNVWLTLLNNYPNATVLGKFHYFTIQIQNL